MPENTSKTKHKKVKTEAFSLARLSEESSPKTDIIMFFNSCVMGAIVSLNTLLGAVFLARLYRACGSFGQTPEGTLSEIEVESSRRNGFNG
ncbi:hypothetical protein CEXT_325521 [Caerostris extrusa]|uniref:Uncharacterized protein n=1 Tax=Caerostris extrusa TaxID=172846 RepID=A0AAV4V0Y4_CAEEX|nr:hypothetical protein CEXT_325521 [Caerostris extrusa]